MRVDVHRHSDLTVTHEVLQGFRVHSGPRLIAAVGVAAYVRSNVRHLHQVDLIVMIDHMVKPVLPVHRHEGHPQIIQIQEP